MPSGKSRPAEHQLKQDLECLRLLPQPCRNDSLRPVTCCRLTKGPWFCSHCCFSFSVDFFLLPLHLAEAVEATEADKSELGHALGQAGQGSPEIYKERQGRKKGGRKAGREKQAGVNVPGILWTPRNSGALPAASHQLREPCHSTRTSEPPFPKLSGADVNKEKAQLPPATSLSLCLIWSTHCGGGQEVNRLGSDLCHLTWVPGGASMYSFRSHVTIQRWDFVELWEKPFTQRSIYVDSRNQVTHTALPYPCQAV